MKQGFRFRKLIQYFLQGLLILAPIAVTFYSIFFVISTIDSWIPIFHYKDEQGISHVQNYGLGFVIIIGVIVIIGYFSSFFITSRIVSFFDKVLEKTPGIKHIYGTTRDFFEAFTGDKKKFTKNVLVNVDETDIWRVGFITQEDMTEFGLVDYVSVYVPSSYSVAGSVFIVPMSRIKFINKISSTQTMKFAVSGGVTELQEE